MENDIHQVYEYPQSPIYAFSENHIHTPRSLARSNIKIVGLNFSLFVVYDPETTVCLATWVERLTPYIWLWSCCVGDSNPGRGTRVGRVFSTEYVIYCQLKINLELVPMVMQKIIDHMCLPHLRLPAR